MDFDEKLSEVEEAKAAAEAALDALETATTVENEKDLEANLSDAVESLNEALRVIRGIRK